MPFFPLFLLMSSRALKPDKPRPLLYLRVSLRDKRCWALLDSGAADHFISEEVAAAANLPLTPFGMPMAVSLGNGQIVYVHNYVMADLRFECYRVLLSLKVLATNIALVLGYPFLWKHRPLIDWRDRTLVFRKRKYKYVVHRHPGDGLSEEALASVENVDPE